MKSQVSFCKTLKNVYSQVSFVKTKMADRHFYLCHAGQRSPHHYIDVVLCEDEVYPDAELNTRALYTLTISSLTDVSTTCGSTNHQVL